MPEASGIDIICMSETDLLARCRLRNNMANTILKEWLAVMPDENLEFRVNQGDEEVDGQDVEQKMTAATGAADWINAVQEAGILDAGDGMQFGIMAQNALEFACKAVIAAHGHEYPASGRGGHDLTILTQLLRDHEIIGRDEEIPGENHRHLSGFGGQQSTPTSTRP